MKLVRKMLNGFLNGVPIKRNLTIREADGWVPADQYAMGAIVNDKTALGLSSVWACVNLLSGTISSLPLVIYKKLPDGSRVVAKDHPLYALLHDRPNFDQTAVDFWDFMAASLELHGNAYALKARSAGRVRSLTPIFPLFVDPYRKPNGTIWYRIRDGGKVREVSETEMFHIRGFGGNPLGGLSTLAFGRKAFGGALSAENVASEIFQNGLKTSGVLKFERWLTKEQRDIATTQIAAKLGQAGKPLVLEGGSDWKALTINPDDAQMLESRGFSVEEICRFFGVPPHMIGHTSKSTSWGTGLEQQTLAFVKFNLRRRLKRIEQACEQQLLTPEDRTNDISIEFNLEGLLRGDSGGRAKFYKEMSSIGAMTINEIRALENLPPVAGGDEPRIQMQNVPITDTGEIEEALKEMRLINEQ